MNRWAGFSIALVLGLAIGIAGTYVLTRPPAEISENTRSGGYSLINPLLACDDEDNIQSANLTEIKNALTSQVSDLISSGKAKRISVYVRDMDRGVWTGVNQDDRYAPASLLKVPIMIAFLKDAEDGSPLLSDELMLPAGTDDNQAEEIKPAAPLPMGHAYSINTLLEAMIEQSDNNAMNALVQKVSPVALNEVFSQFSVPVAVTNTDNAVSPRDYMRFFRILYNGTYLTHTDSQHALELLAKVKYDAGLGAGVPVGMTVAHKFGEREIINPDGSMQSAELHDCGIVYYPHLPYGICIMTEGIDINSLQSVIQTLSNTVFTQVDKGMLPKAN